MIQQLNLKSKSKNAADFFFLKQSKSHSRKSAWIAREKEELVSINELNKVCYENDHLKNNLKW